MANLLYIIEGGLVGGAEQVLLTVIKKIDKAQHKIKVCLLKPSEVLESELKAIRMPVFILNMSGKWDIASFIKLVRFMRREKIDIAHTSLYAANTIGRIAAILARVPVIISWEHGEVFYKIPRHSKVNRILAKFSDSIVACSENAKEEMMKKEAIPADKIKVIYNCIDFDRFNLTTDGSIIRKEIRVKPGEMLIGTVAALSDRVKGQGYLIRAMPLIIKEFPNAKLLLVGEGPSKSDFIRMVKNLNLNDRIIFTGFRRDIPEIMSALDLYVCPSNYEALPVSVIEAMSLKKPVVATCIGGISEVVIENQTGYLVLPKDVGSIAHAIISLLSDREKIRKMGEAGFERAKVHFSPETVIGKIEALYRELLWKKHQKSL